MRIWRGKSLFAEVMHTNKMLDGCRGNGDGGSLLSWRAGCCSLGSSPFNHSHKPNPSSESIEAAS